MIKIRLRNKEELLQNYLDKMEGWIARRAKFILRIFEMDSSTDLEEFKKNTDDGLRPNTQLKLLKLFLASEYYTDSLDEGLVALKDPGKWNTNVQNDFEEIRKMILRLSNIENIKAILAAEPSEMMSLEKNILAESKEINLSKKIVETIFDYGRFSDKNQHYNAFTHAEVLGMYSCSYCDMDRIPTIRDQDDKFIQRSPFDHFFSQIDHPLFSVSFHNLIPSCTYCNSTYKKQLAFSLQYQVHPFIDEFGEDATFTYELVDLDGAIANPNNYEIRLEVHAGEGSEKRKQLLGDESKKQRELGNIPVFQLRERYKDDPDCRIKVAQMRSFFDSKSKKYVASIRDFLTLTESEQADYYLLYCGRLWGPENFGKNTHSKLTYDIFNEFLRTQ